MMPFHLAGGQVQEESFKLPGSSYEEVTKIIRAYLHFAEPAGLGEIKTVAAMHETQISRNVGFLLAMRVLDGGRDKVLTPLGRQLGQAMEHEVADEVARCWRHLISESEFLNKVLAAIRIRKGMDRETLESHIAYTAGQPKKSSVMTGATTVVDLLLAARAIGESDGKYVVSDEEAPVPNDQLLTSPKLGQVAPPRTVSVTAATEQVNSVVKFQINININCTSDELDGLADRLHRLMDELQKPRGAREQEVRS